MRGKPQNPPVAGAIGESKHRLSPTCPHGCHVQSAQFGRLRCHLPYGVDRKVAQPLQPRTRQPHSIAARQQQRVEIARVADIPFYRLHSEQRQADRAMPRRFDPCHCGIGTW